MWLEGQRQKLGPRISRRGEDPLQAMVGSALSTIGSSITSRQVGRMKKDVFKLPRNSCTMSFTDTTTDSSKNAKYAMEMQVLTVIFNNVLVMKIHRRLVVI